MSIAECVGFHWDGDRYGKKFGVSADWLMHGAAHFCWARHGSCAFLLGTAWELRIFAGSCGAAWEWLIHSEEHGVCGVVQFLEVAAGTGESVFIVFCVCGTPGTALCSSWRSPLGQDARYPWSFAWVVRHGRLSVGIRVRSCVALHGPYWAIFS